MSLLENVKSPEDLKKIPLDQLPDLAEEIRALIVQTVNNNGGHMASNLGAVELTIALHWLFDSPTDTILFDVSHQSYTHKILTGRQANFLGIRTSGGYSGYFDKDESPHDILTLGHAGCAPSLALGVALGKKLKGEKGCVVCVIGDGGLTNGLAYEGLSNIIAQNPTNLIVILNDNGMAINENVGWMASWRDRWLPHLRNSLEIDPDFKEFQKVTQSLSKKVPGGGFMLDLAKGMKQAVQKAVIPSIGQFWDEMGFNYLGPVNGHNFNELVEYLRAGSVATNKVPLIHVITNKGQGLEAAQSDPVHFHQPGKVGPPKKKETYSKFFARALSELMMKDKRIVAISAAMLEGTGLAEIQPYFKDRIIDVGICEGHAVSMAAGMARSGLRPIVCIYSTFLQRSLDQIVHDVCMNDLPVVFALDRAGLVGQDGKTHHGLFDLAYMRVGPNMVVTAPWNEKELQDLLATAFSQDHPFSLRFPKGEITGMSGLGEPEIVPVPTSQIFYHGKDLCLVGVGSLVGPALDAWHALQNEQIEVGVANMRFIKPVDPELLRELSDNYRDVLVIEEGTSAGGASAAILEAMEQNGRAFPQFHLLSTGDGFPDHGEVSELKQQLGLDVPGIVDKVHRIMKGGA